MHTADNLITSLFTVWEVAFEKGCLTGMYLLLRPRQAAAGCG